MLRYVCANPNCGKRFKMEREPTTKIKCPKCGAKLERLDLDLPPLFEAEGLPPPLTSEETVPEPKPPAHEGPLTLRDLLDKSSAKFVSGKDRGQFLEFACECCGARRRARATMRGKTVLCPGCSEFTRVPASATSKSAAAAKPSGKPPAAKSPAATPSTRSPAARATGPAAAGRPANESLSLDDLAFLAAMEREEDEMKPLGTKPPATRPAASKPSASPKPSAGKPTPGAKPPLGSKPTSIKPGAKPPKRSL